MIFLSTAVRARPNLTIRPETLVDRVAFSDGQATVVHIAGGEAIPAGEVLLCAGVYGSPAIMLRSGIGPGRHLRGIGIEVTADLPVGERLQDQPLYVLSYLLKPDAGANPPDGSAVLWTSSSEAQDGELDLQLSVSVQPDLGPDGAPVRTLRIWASVVTPRSIGTVRLKSRDPHVTPRIDYGLLDDPADKRRLRDLVKLARTIMSREPIAGLLDRELLPGPGTQADDELDASILAGLMTFYHGVGTAPMGRADDPAAAVDAEGRVHGIRGLRVVDASIFPEAISVPVNLTTLMVAERVASRMCKD